MNFSLEMSPVRYRWIDLILCLPFLLIPLAIELPYRVNIFLSWEGAYRLYLGQMPFRDFGLPMGFGYWLIPAGFFHLLGPSMFSLVVAQVFINGLSLVSLRGLLYNTGLKAYQVTLLLVVFCLTYVIYNFWPWYNHSVIVFELVSLWMLTAYLAADAVRGRVVWLVISAFFAFLSFFTKQDAGAICIVLCLAILVNHSVSTRKYIALGTFVATLGSVALLAILPFLQYDFLYWFNLGQPPHDSRVTIGKLLNVILGDSTWEKVYLAVIVIGLVAAGNRAIEHFRTDWRSLLLLFISVVMIGQAMITRATSPLPTDHMTYFHAFGIAGILSLLPLFNISPHPKAAFASFVVIVLLFSAGYWKYVSGVLHLTPTNETTTQNTSPAGRWIGTQAKGFERVTMPEGTASGIQRLLSETPAQRPLKVLNMSELTPLALSMGYTPPTNQPLWYHLNIGIFDKEVDEFCKRIEGGEYDIVLFEDIPDLTHFYPYRVRDALREHYVLKDSFMAPRKLENSTIEVYVRPQTVQRAK